jgi:hypothetical protein
MEKSKNLVILCAIHHHNLLMVNLTILAYAIVLIFLSIITSFKKVSLQ